MTEIKLVCINDTGAIGITLHKTYISHSTVKTLQFSNVLITNDNNEIGEYKSGRFITLEEFRTINLKNLLL